MAKLELSPFSPTQSLQMHQTRYVGARNDLSPVSRLIVETITAHAGGYRLFFHSEGPAKTAAFIGPIKRRNRDVWYASQQVVHDRVPRNHELRGTAQTQAAKSVAALVDCNRTRVARKDHILGVLRYKMAELEESIRECSTWQTGVGRRDVLLGVKDTTARRAYNLVKLAKIVSKRFRDFRGLVLEARVSQRLSAASLFHWILHCEPKLLQYRHRRPSHLRIELINVTWNKQPNRHDEHRLLLARIKMNLLTSDIK